MPVSYVMWLFLMMGSLMLEHTTGCATCKDQALGMGVKKTNKRVVSIPAQLLKAVVSGT